MYSSLLDIFKITFCRFHKMNPSIVKEMHIESNQAILAQATTVNQISRAHLMIGKELFILFKFKLNRNTISASSQSVQYCDNHEYLCAETTFIQ